VEGDNDRILLFMVVDVDVLHGGRWWHYDLLKVKAMAVLSLGRKPIPSATYHRRCSSVSCSAGGSRGPGYVFS